jgi:hypothetical protein
MVSISDTRTVTILGGLWITPLQSGELKIGPKENTFYGVKTPLVFEPDYIKYRLEIIDGLLPKGYKIVKENDE